jgi:phosphoribosylanthranilate isomerase
LRIKICGITTEADAEEAALLGADAIGLNFYEQSLRCIDLPTAESILRALPPFVDPVGLFVNLPLAVIAETLRGLARIRTIQWYGEKHEAWDPHPFQLIAAFSVREEGDLCAVNQYLNCCRQTDRLPAALLVDAHVAGQYGGTGQKAPWHLLADFRPGVPLILAGGLTPENVAEAIRIVRPYAVDVASGVEQGPGRKDREKMRRFIDNARNAAAG